MAKLPKRPTHLLIDGDVIAFMAAAAVQAVLIDDFGWCQPIAHTANGEACVENYITGLMAGLKGDTYEVVLSDPKENWRRGVDPNYKTNRTGPRPMLLGYLKDYLAEKHGAKWWPELEADDTLSIKMTTPGYGAPLPGEEGYAQIVVVPRLICVGRDKDFKSIPGLHHAIKQDIGPNGEMRVREVSRWEADRFHLIQTLAGDAVDGFPGCPGIGMTRAAQIIDAPVRLVPQEGVKTRGVNKGESVTKWMAEPTADLWACIVSHYRKAGQGEEEALVTARLCRLLRFDEYDKVDQRITLWTPEKITSV
jgi:DNA polymerase-1